MQAIRTTCVSFGLTLASALTPPPAAAAGCGDRFPFVCLFGTEAAAREPSMPVIMTELYIEPREARQPMRPHPSAKKTAATRPADKAGRPTVSRTAGKSAATKPAAWKVAAQNDSGLIKSADLFVLRPQQAAPNEIVVQETMTTAKAAPAIFQPMATDARAAQAAAASAPMTPRPTPIAAAAEPGPAFAMSLRLTPIMAESMRPLTSACLVEQSFNDLFRAFPEGRGTVAAAAETIPQQPLRLISLHGGHYALREKPVMAALAVPDQTSFAETTIASAMPFPGAP